MLLPGRLYNKFTIKRSLHRSWVKHLTVPDCEAPLLEIYFQVLFDPECYDSIYRTVWLNRNVWNYSYSISPYSEKKKLLRKNKRKYKLKVTRMVFLNCLVGNELRRVDIPSKSINQSINYWRPHVQLSKW